MMKCHSCAVFAFSVFLHCYHISYHYKGNLLRKDEAHTHRARGDSARSPLGYPAERAALGGKYYPPGYLRNEAP